MHPIQYLIPDYFTTPFDSLHVNNGYADKQYQKGLDLGHNARYITIVLNGAWSSMMLDASLHTSCETIGLHACTADLLRGFIDSKATIMIYDAGEYYTIQYNPERQYA